MSLSEDKKYADNIYLFDNGTVGGIMVSLL